MALLDAPMRGYLDADLYLPRILKLRQFSTQ